MRWVGDVSYLLTVWRALPEIISVHPLYWLVIYIIRLTYMLICIGLKNEVIPCKILSYHSGTDDYIRHIVYLHIQSI